MSNNMTRKLQLKAELIRHLDTAVTKMEQGQTSSSLKVLALNFEIQNLDLGIEPDLMFWNEVMAQ